MLHEAVHRAIGLEVRIAPRNISIPATVTEEPRRGNDEEGDCMTPKGKSYTVGGVSRNLWEL